MSGRLNYSYIENATFHSESLAHSVISHSCEDRKKIKTLFLIQCPSYNLLFNELFAAAENKFLWNAKTRRLCNIVELPANNLIEDLCTFLARRLYWRFRLWRHVLFRLISANRRRFNDTWMSIQTMMQKNYDRVSIQRSAQIKRSTWELLFLSWADFPLESSVCFSIPSRTRTTSGFPRSWINVIILKKKKAKTKRFFTHATYGFLCRCFGYSGWGNENKRTNTPHMHPGRDRLHTSQYFMNRQFHVASIDDRHFDLCDNWNYRQNWLGSMNYFVAHAAFDDSKVFLPRK